MKAIVLSAFLCFVAVLGTSHGVEGHECGIHFLVTSPKILLAGTTERICVNLLNDSSVEFVLSLVERQENGTTLAESVNSMDTDNECFDLEIPSIEGSRETVLLVFQAKDMAHPEEGFVCNANKSVLISSETMETLIQTDKPIYKPGQPVKFRMMTVDKEFMPSTSPVPLIYVETPNQIRLAQWEEVEREQGLVDLEFPMTSEPLLGTWKIKADMGDRTVEQPFTVEEYVLPKYEVTIDAPSYIVITDTAADVTICAKYTYGQPVRGTVSADVSVTRSSYRGDGPAVTYSGEADRTGCYAFEVDLRPFELRSYRNYYWNARLKIHATFTDSATGEDLEKTGESGKVSHDALSLAINVPKSFKPGVPFYGRITVNYPDGKPAGGKFINMTSQSKTTKHREYAPLYNQTFTSPDTGIIEFEIPDIDFETTDIIIYAEAPGYKSTPDVNSTDVSIYDPFASAYPSAQYSPSGSFIQIEPIREKLVPGSEQTLTIHFTSDDPDASENTQLYYVFMSLGDVLDVDVSSPSASRRRRQAGEEEEEDGNADGDGDGDGDGDIVVDIEEGPVNGGPPFDEDCKGDLVFNECGTACPLICGQPEPDLCVLLCVIGCACPDGLYRDSENGTRCMARENCTDADLDDFDLIEIDSIIIDPPVYVYPPIDYPDIEVAEPGKLYTVQRTFDVTPEMTPVTSLLVYFIRPDGEVVADSLTFDVEEMFENEVTMEFSDEEVEPDGETSLEITADPSSLCAVGIVDKSVYVLGGENQLTKKEAFDYVRNFQLNRYGLFTDYSSKCPSRYSPYLAFKRRKRSSVPYYHRPSSSFIDSSKAFKDIGLIYLTNIDVETKPCPKYTPFPYYYRSNVPQAVPVVLDDNIVLESSEDVPLPGAVGAPEVRSYFPETFLWDLVPTSETGEAEVSLTAPHTITDWIASGFCISPENGLGIAPSATLRTFQPFFLTYSLPYSVIRGENVPVKVTVFNYLDACLVVRLTIQDSTKFDLVSESASQEVCVCGGMADSVEYRIIPNYLGEMPIEVHGESVVDSNTLCGNELLSDQTGASDGIRKNLLVKAEGVPADYSFSQYFCISDHSIPAFSVNAPIFLPQNYVPDSAAGKIIVTGDLLGPSLENLEHLIRLPTGCGEQNMLGFVPNIVALEYLTSTNQLTGELDEKIKGYMRTGYQRELNYRHSDGSYSAFGERDPSGNTWLTAFVVRSLAQASKYIFVDKADLNVSIAWLKGLQDEETGCIESVGRLGYKAMMGGVSGESMLTAYVVTTYLEAGLPPTDDGVVQGLRCVTAQLDTVEDNYALAQIAYTLALAGQTEDLAPVMKKLDANAEVQSGLKFWTSNRPQPRSDYYYTASGDSISIEINSYIILTNFLQHPPEAAREKSVSTVRWLIKQRGVQGGFVSTQDTVMGLTALGKFAAGGGGPVDLYIDARLISRDPTAARGGRRFYVREQNKRVQQEFPFGDTYSIALFRSRGTGCALIQVAVKYNIKPQTPVAPSFNLKTSVDQLPSKKGNCYDYRVTIVVNYGIEDDVSNMALVTVVPPSGFYAVKSSLADLLKTNREIKRYEIDGDEISFYFDSLDSEGATFSFEVTKEFDVEDVKPGFVKVTDYYETSLSESTLLDIVCDPNVVPIPREIETVLPTGIIEVILEEVEAVAVVRDPGEPRPTDEPEQDSDEDYVEATPFGGFGRHQGGKDGEDEVGKPDEGTEEDKPGEGYDKITPEHKEDLNGTDTDETATVDGDGDQEKGVTEDEGPADKPKDQTATFPESMMNATAEPAGTPEPPTAKETAAPQEVKTTVAEEVEVPVNEGKTTTAEDTKVQTTEAVKVATSTTEMKAEVDVKTQTPEVKEAGANGTTMAPGGAQEATATTPGATMTTDFDECSVPDICGGPQFQCVNVPGTYECQCAEGYTLDPPTGECYDCAYCGEVPSDGMERFCNSDFAYVVKRRKSDFRLLRDMRYVNEIVPANERLAKSFVVADEDFCECTMIQHKEVDRFILFANTANNIGDKLSIDRSATILPFSALNDLETWRAQCP